MKNSKQTKLKQSSMSVNILIAARKHLWWKRFMDRHLSRIKRKSERKGRGTTRRWEWVVTTTTMMIWRVKWNDVKKIELRGGCRNESEKMTHFAIATFSSLFCFNPPHSAVAQWMAIKCISENGRRKH